MMWSLCPAATASWTTQAHMQAAESRFVAYAAFTQRQTVNGANAFNAMSLLFLLFYSISFGAINLSTRLRMRTRFNTHTHTHALIPRKSTNILHLRALLATAALEAGSLCAFEAALSATKIYCLRLMLTLRVFCLGVYAECVRSG